MCLKEGTQQRRQSVAPRLSQSEEGRLFKVGSHSSFLSQFIRLKGCLLRICPKVLYMVAGPCVDAKET